MCGQICGDFLESFFGDGIEAASGLFVLQAVAGGFGGAWLVFPMFSRFVDGLGGFRRGVFGFDILIRWRLGVL